MEQFIMDFLEKFGFPAGVAGYFMFRDWKQGEKLRETLQGIGEVQAALLVMMVRSGTVKNRKNDINEDSLKKMASVNPLLAKLM